MSWESEWAMARSGNLRIEERAPGLLNERELDDNKPPNILGTDVTTSRIWLLYYEFVRLPNANYSESFGFIWIEFKHVFSFLMKFPENAVGSLQTNN